MIMEVGIRLGVRKRGVEEAVKNWRTCIPFNRESYYSVWVCENARLVGPETPILRESGKSNFQVKFPDF